MLPTVTPLASSVVMIRVRRGTRSATAPPINRNTRLAPVKADTNAPSSKATPEIAADRAESAQLAQKTGERPGDVRGRHTRRERSSGRGLNAHRHAGERDERRRAGALGVRSGEEPADEECGLKYPLEREGA